jgi:hypothetical protein
MPPSQTLRSLPGRRPRSGSGRGESPGTSVYRSACPCRTSVPVLLLFPSMKLSAVDVRAPSRHAAIGHEHPMPASQALYLLLCTQTDCGAGGRCGLSPTSHVTKSTLGSQGPRGIVTIEESGCISPAFERHSDQSLRVHSLCGPHPQTIPDGLSTSGQTAPSHARWPQSDP